MRFGLTRTEAAVGLTLGHSVHVAGEVLKKGRKLTAADVARITDAGIGEVYAAGLDTDDIGEDEAARRIAARLGGPGIRVAPAATGRVNLYAESAGLLSVDRERLIALNSLDEGLTVATLSPDARVAEGAMVATVKIIPFALAQAVVERAEALLGDVAPIVALARFTPHRAGLVLTRVGGTKASVLAKRRRVIEDRVVAAGSEIVQTLEVVHETSAIERAIRSLREKDCDPILVFGASAIVDRGDVIPAAVARAGGEVVHLGMPVDPGNLLMLGKLGTIDVIGVPSCAASPKLNGFDWVLERRLAGRPVGRAEIVAMAPGGLLMEIESRPSPREGGPAVERRRPAKVAAIVLAAGRSTRMGEGRNKLTTELDGKAIVRRTVEAALASKARPIVVVTGHQREAVEAALAGLDVSLAHNPDFAEGLSTSLRTGLSALPVDVDAVAVLLGDMPLLPPALIDRLIAAFEPKEGRAIVVPVRNGRRGNPVIWGRGYFAALMSLRGDVGAKHVLAENAEAVAEVEAQTDAIFIDIDTPEALGAVAED
ncbi:MAG: molybdopterin-binding/glycosyltransferase family 2 protein [Hyphomicrobiaceae bacterium]